MQWKTDWGLRSRMALTMFLLFGLYIVLIGALVAYGMNMIGVVIMVGIFSFIQYWGSDKLALRSMGAKRVDESEHPELHDMVTRLSRQADLPKPDVAVARSQVPNAFATGRNQRNATVAVTAGLMQTLDADEMEGVIAHELAHIKNRDVMVMTVASFLASVAFIIVRWGWLFGGNNRNAAPVWIAILVSLVVWVLSFFLMRALSRYREYSADRGAAAMTGKPAALASALMKISGRMDKVPESDMREQAEMNAFFIIPIRSGFIGKIASTHPPTEERIDRLQDLEREMATA